jgi:hypothetical protein
MLLPVSILPPTPKANKLNHSPKQAAAQGNFNRQPQIVKPVWRPAGDRSSNQQINKEQINFTLQISNPQILKSP